MNSLREAILSVKHQPNKDGWSFDFDFLKEVAKLTNNYDEGVSMEQVETVLFSIIDSKSRLSNQPAESTREKLIELLITAQNTLDDNGIIDYREFVDNYLSNQSAAPSPEVMANVTNAKEPNDL